MLAARLVISSLPWITSWHRWGPAGFENAAILSAQARENRSRWNTRRRDASAPRGHLHFLKSGVLRGICTNSGVGSSFLVFSLLASNQDDYFRNHGFLIRVAGP